MNKKHSYDEVARVPSPDGRIDAVIVTGHADATVSTPYSVHLVPHQGAINVKDTQVNGERTLVMQGSHVSDLRVSWAEKGVLDIKYEKVKIDDFKNYWLNSKNYNDVVEIRLKPHKQKSL